MLTYECNDPKCDSERAIWTMNNGRLEIKCAKCNKTDEQALIK